MDNKKCLECANSECVKDENGFSYICKLSKKKNKDCLNENNNIDYFKEM